MDLFFEIPEIIVRAFVSIIVLFLLAKLMGKKQISQLTFFDYVIGISIGSIAAAMAVDDDIPFYVPLIAMAVYSFVSFLLSILTNKSIILRRMINGTPIILLEDGKLIKKNFKRARIELNEFLCECRVQGFFDLSEIKAAIIETNGRISILPIADKRPVQPYDMNLSPTPATLVANVIMDGNIMLQNLKHIGKDEQWLKTQLKNKKMGAYHEIFLATCDTQGNLYICSTDEKAHNNNIFE